MSNTGSNYRGTLDSDGMLVIKSNMNDWRLISGNVCTNIDVLLDFINIRDGNARLMVLLDNKSTSWYMRFVLTEIVF